MKSEVNKRLYNIWSCMKQRCNNPKHTAATWYHDKGIRVCAEWNDFIPFQCWALKNGYSNNLTIDRIDPNRNYEPDNCQWITMEDNRKKIQRRKIGTSKRNTTKIGKFMIVREEKWGHLDVVEVVEIGMTKPCAMNTIRALKEKEPYGDYWYYCRVTDGRKKGDFVQWENTRAYLNSKE